MEESKLANIKVDDGAFEFSVDPNVMDDVELIELLGRSDDDFSAIIKIIKLVVGDKVYDDIKAHYVEKYGRMSVSKHLSEVMTEIFKVFPKL